MRHRMFTVGMAATLMALPAVASAQTPDPAPTTTSTSFTLLGTGLTVEVVLDADGTIEGVNLDPSGGATVDEQSSHEVEFAFDGTSTEVTVQVENDQLKLEVESAALADLAGPGQWTGDVFGTGTVVVDYTVSDDGGSPSVTIDGVTAPAGVDYQIVPGDSGAEVVFTMDGKQKTLVIEIDGDGSDVEMQVALEGGSYESTGAEEGSVDEQEADTNDSVDEQETEENDSVDEQETEEHEDSIDDESEESDDHEAEDAEVSHEETEGTSDSVTSNG